MKAEELRIGNWIITPSDFNDRPDFERHEQVYDIYFDTDEGARFINEWNVEFIKPIPLTPEILEKCGFEDEKPGWGVWQIKSLHTSFKLLQPVENDTAVGGPLIVKIFDCVSYCDGYPLVIEHLHQLQNLYFALIGEELQIKF